VKGEWRGRERDVEGRKGKEERGNGKYRGIHLKGDR